MPENHATELLLDQSPLAAFAFEAMQAGLPVFPCNVEKQPLTKHGYKDATTDPEAFKGMSWARAPYYGFPTGCITDCVIVDVDGHEHNPELTPEQNEQNRIARSQWVESHLDILVTTRTYKSPRGGFHYEFQASNPAIRSNASVLAPKVDIRGEGGYVCRDHGERYVLVNDVPRKPLPPELEQEILAAKGCKLIQPKKKGNGLLNGASGADYEPDELTGQTIICEGGRNSELTRIAGGMVGRGESIPAIKQELLRVNSEQCKPPLDEDEVLKIANSVARYPSESKKGEANTESLPEYDPNKTYWVPKVRHLPDELKSFPESAKHLLKLCGWINGHARTTFPEGTQAAAITIAGMMGSRLIYGQDGAQQQATTTYLNVVGSSGIGKNYASEAVKNFAINTQYPAYEDFTSEAAFRNVLSQSPAVQFLVDEMGDKFSQGLRNTNNGYVGAMAFLRIIYSASTTALMPKALAKSNFQEKDQKAILRPCLGLLTLTTSGQFEAAIINNAAFHNGTLNRFVHLFIADDVATDDHAERAPVPQWLIDRMEMVESHNRTNGKTLISVGRQLPETEPLRHLTYGDECQAHLSAFVKRIAGWVGRSEFRANIASRWRENAMRIAVALTLFEYPEATEVDANLMAWSIAFTHYHGLQMAQFLEERADTDSTYGRQRKKAIEVIRNRTAEKRPMTLTDFSRSAPGSSMKARDRQELLNDLLLSGYLQFMKRTSERADHKKPCTILVAV